MSDGYDVEPGELQRAAQEITGCVPAPRDVPLEEIPGNAEWYGHGGVYEALSRFCATWQIATALFSKNAEQAGGSLVAAAAEYVRQNQLAEESFGGIGAAIGEVVDEVGGGIGTGISKGVGAIGEGVADAASAIADRLGGGVAGGSAGDKIGDALGGRYDIDDIGIVGNGPDVRPGEGAS